MITYHLEHEPVYSSLTPVPLDQYQNNNDQENTPPLLVIDTDKELCASQTILSDYFPRSDPVGERLPRAATNSAHTKECFISNNPSCHAPVGNRPNGVDRYNKERPAEDSV